MKRIQGFSLIELMIAMAIGLITVGGITLVLLSSSTIYRGSDNRAGIQENARFGLSVLQEDARMAGYMGCFNLKVEPSRFTNLAKSPTSFLTNYAVPVSGLEASGTGWTPALVATEIGLGGHTPTAGNDILILRTPTGRSTTLTAQMAKADNIPVGSAAGFADGAVAVVSDCDYANLVVLSAAPTGNTLPHGIGTNSNKNTTIAFSNIKGATATPVATVVYFVAAASDGISGNTSLWRQVGSAAGEEIADGVTQLQLEYGVDTKTTSDGVTTKFVPASAVGTAVVTAVKVSMLLRSRDDGLARAAQVYKFGGASQTATDKRLYIPFTTTIALRNRVR